MNCKLNFEVTVQDANNCNVDVDVCDEVMQCPCCCYFLDKRNKVDIEIIINDVQKFPNKVTIIKIPLHPLPETKFYYSFVGIETIIFNLFKSSNKKFIENLEKHKGFLKVYYQRDPLFTLPSIMIEVIFFAELNSKSVDELWKTLKAEVLFFTGSVGDIEIIEINGEQELTNLLSIPLLIGQPEFKLEGALLHHKFNIEQIKEMNYLHSVSIIPLEMKNVINNNMIELFELQRLSIQKEMLDSNSLYDEDDLKDVFDSIFRNGTDNQPYNHELIDDLPF